MPKRSSKPPRDENRAAFEAIRRLTGDGEPEEPEKGQDMPQSTGKAPGKKNPHAVALGRRGGQKGGPSRAKKLTPEERRKIAQKAAKARWKSREDSNLEG